MNIGNLLALQTVGAGGWLGFAPLIFIFAIFYFLLIMPQQRRQKKWQQMLNDLKNGDKVVTSGGLRGTDHRAARRLHPVACPAGQFAHRSDPGLGGVGGHAGGQEQQSGMKIQSSAAVPAAARGVQRAPSKTSRRYKMPALRRENLIVRP